MQRTRTGNILSLSTISVGMGLFIAWQNALGEFLYPSSAGMILSPVLVGDTGALFLFALCYLSYRHDSQKSFSAQWFIGLMVIGSLAGSITGGMVAQTLLPLWGIYLAAMVSGYASAMLVYAWAQVLLRLSASRALDVVLFGLLIGGIVEWAASHTTALAIPFSVLFFGLVSCACYASAARRIESDDEPLLFRPKESMNFLKLGIGLMVLAAALGITAGTTAQICTEESMRVLNDDMTMVTVLFSSVLLACNVLTHHRITLGMLLKLAPSVLVIVILINIAVPSFAQVWLSITLFGWLLIRLLTLLFLLEVSRRRIVSLPLLFPAAWALLFGGHALGEMLGQNWTALTVGFDHPIDDAIVLIAILVVCSSMFVLSNPLFMGTMLSDDAIDKIVDHRPHTLGSSEERDSTSAILNCGKDLMSGSATKATDESYVDDFEQRCRRIAQNHYLSSREEEVFVLLARGHTRVSIARKLFISENTVRAHVKSIYTKLYIHSKQQLINLVDKD